MDEHQPVDQNEFLYRRIPHAFFRPTLPVLFLIAAFRPTTNDTTGLSVFRAAFLRPEDTLANVPPARRNDYYVASLAVSDLRALGLTVVPEPDPQGPPGHAVIPELSWAAYQADKNRLKVVLVELARLASARHRASTELIVYFAASSGRFRSAVQTPSRRTLAMTGPSDFIVTQAT